MTSASTAAGAAASSTAAVADAAEKESLLHSNGPQPNSKDGKLKKQQATKHFVELNRRLNSRSYMWSCH